MGGACRRCGRGLNLAEGPSSVRAQVRSACVLLAVLEGACVGTGRPLAGILQAVATTTAISVRGISGLLQQPMMVRGSPPSIHPSGLQEFQKAFVYIFFCSKRFVSERRGRQALNDNIFVEAASHKEV